MVFSLNSTQLKELKPMKAKLTNYDISQRFIKNARPLKVPMKIKNIKKLTKFKLKAIIKSNKNNTFVLIEDKKKNLMLSLEEEYLEYRLIAVEDKFAIFQKKRQSFKILLEKNMNSHVDLSEFEEKNEIKDHVVQQTPLKTPPKSVEKNRSIRPGL